MPKREDTYVIALFLMPGQCGDSRLGEGWELGLPRPARKGRRVIFSCVEELKLLQRR